jgi:hypothetical protein
MKPHQTYSGMEESFLSAKQFEERDQNYQLTISGRGVISLLVSVMLVLLCCHLLAWWLFYHDKTDTNFIRYFDRYFNFNLENNFPSFFSALILFFSALLLGLIYKLTKVTDTYKKRWLLLSVVFLFLSMDEALKIHERVEHLSRLVFTNNLDGFLFWTWIIPYVLLALVVASFCFRMVLQLPKAVRNKFILAGTLYVFAAAGTESIEGHLMKITAEDPVVLMITTTIQELLEMVSIIIFIAGLLAYLAMKMRSIRLSIY